MPRRKSSGRKIGVIGSINRDTIHRVDGSSVTSWGGILYNLKYLSESGAATIIPAVNVGFDGHARVMAILSRLSNLDLSQVRMVDAENNHCFIHYADQTHKCEFLKGGVPPLTFRRVAPLLDSDLILVNFISGWDITLPALELLRRRYTGTIYIDIHSLTLGRKKVPGGFRRHLRRPRFWRRYAECADILQVNQAEFEVLSAMAFSPDNARRFLAEDLPSVRCLCLTLGRRGSLVLERSREIRAHLVPAKEVLRPCDTTGCGDIFAAGFIAQYLTTGDVLAAAVHGNRLAAARCRTRGPIF
jgi:hypothetical protein